MQTRSQTKGIRIEPKAATKKAKSEIKAKRLLRNASRILKKRKVLEESREKALGEQHGAKGLGDSKNKPTEIIGKEATCSAKLDYNKLSSLMSKYGQLPLFDLISSGQSPGNIIMAHILNAMLSSTRINHKIAHKTLKCIIEANYHDLKVLKKSRRRERLELMWEGGYTRYDEKTATALGELTKLMRKKYGE